MDSIGRRNSVAPGTHPVVLDPGDSGIQQPAPLDRTDANGALGVLPQLNPAGDAAPMRQPHPPAQNVVALERKVEDLTTQLAAVNRRYDDVVSRLESRPGERGFKPTIGDDLKLLHIQRRLTELDLRMAQRNGSTAEVDAFKDELGHTHADIQAKVREMVDEANSRSAEAPEGSSGIAEMDATLRMLRQQRSALNGATKDAARCGCDQGVVDDYGQLKEDLGVAIATLSARYREAVTARGRQAGVVRQDPVPVPVESRPPAKPLPPVPRPAPQARDAQVVPGHAVPARLPEPQTEPPAGQPPLARALMMSGAPHAIPQPGDGELDPINLNDPVAQEIRQARAGLRPPSRRAAPVDDGTRKPAVQTHPAAAQPNLDPAPQGSNATADPLPAPQSEGVQSQPQPVAEVLPQMEPAALNTGVIPVPPPMPKGGVKPRSPIGKPPQVPAGAEAAKNGERSNASAPTGELVALQKARLKKPSPVTPPRSEPIFDRSVESLINKGKGRDIEEEEENSAEWEDEPVKAPVAGPGDSSIPDTTPEQVAAGKSVEESRDVPASTRPLAPAPVPLPETPTTPESVADLMAATAARLRNDIEGNDADDWTEEE